MVGPGVALALGALSAIGTVGGGIAQYQASRYNAKLAEQQAEAARRAAAYEEWLARRKQEIALGRQRAAYASSGVTMEGTPLDVLAESARMAELDALMTRYRGEVSAMSYESKASSLLTEGMTGLVGGIVRGAAGLAGSVATYVKDTYKPDVTGPARIW